MNEDQTITAIAHALLSTRTKLGVDNLIEDLQDDLMSVSMQWKDGFGDRPITEDQVRVMDKLTESVIKLADAN